MSDSSWYNISFMREQELCLTLLQKLRISDTGEILWKHLLNKRRNEVASALWRLPEQLLPNFKVLLSWILFASTSSSPSSGLYSLRLSLQMVVSRLWALCCFFAPNWHKQHKLGWDHFMHLYFVPHKEGLCLRQVLQKEEKVFERMIIKWFFLNAKFYMSMVNAGRNVEGAVYICRSDVRRDT